MNNGPPPPTPYGVNAPLEAFAVFCGYIDEPAGTRFAQCLSRASNQNIAHLHVLFQSVGGNVHDGIFLYNLFRAFPCDLTIYNSGCVGSIAVISYLGAKKRKASAGATFVIHRSTCS